MSMGEREGDKRAEINKLVGDRIAGGEETPTAIRHDSDRVACLGKAHARPGMQTMDSSVTAAKGDTCDTWREGWETKIQGWNTGRLVSDSGLDRETGRDIRKGWTARRSET